MIDQFNEAAREFNEALARKGPECATANGTNYATLTIGGVAAPVCNVVFYDDVDVSIDGCSRWWPRVDVDERGGKTFARLTWEAKP